MSKSQLTGNPNGRPPIFKTPEEMGIKIEEYFDYCDNRIKQVHSKEGESYAISNPEPYTMSGLAYALGMDRKTLMNYKKKDGFFPTIKRARDRVESDVEKRMSDKETFTPGLIFNAKNNFDWKDKTEIDHSGEAVPILVRFIGADNVIDSGQDVKDD
jgi:hypothetical protein